MDTLVSKQFYPNGNLKKKRTLYRDHGPNIDSSWYIGGALQEVSIRDSMVLSPDQDVIYKDTLSMFKPVIGTTQKQWDWHVNGTFKEKRRFGRNFWWDTAWYDDGGLAHLRYWDFQNKAKTYKAYYQNGNLYCESNVEFVYRESNTEIENKLTEYSSWYDDGKMMEYIKTENKKNIKRDFWTNEGKHTLKNGKGRKLEITDLPLTSQTKSMTHYKRYKLHGRKIDYILVSTNDSISKDQFQKVSLENYRDGELIGICKRWYPNGTLKEKSRQSWNRGKHGRFVYRHENGHKWKVEYYRRDRLKKTVRFH